MARSFANRLGQALGRLGASSGYVPIAKPRWGQTIDMAASSIHAPRAAVQPILEGIARIMADPSLSIVNTIVAQGFVADLCERICGIPDPSWRGLLDDAAELGYTLGAIEEQQTRETVAGSSSPRFAVVRQQLREKAGAPSLANDRVATLYAFDCGYWIARSKTDDCDSLLDGAPSGLAP